MSRMKLPPGSAAGLRWEATQQRYKIGPYALHAPPRESLVRQKRAPTLEEKHQLLDRDRRRRRLFNLWAQFWPTVFDGPVPYPVPAEVREAILDFYKRGGEFSMAEVVEALSEWDQRCRVFRAE